MKRIFIYTMVIFLLCICMVIICHYGNRIAKRDRKYTSTVKEVTDANLIQLSNGSIVELAGIYIPKKGEVNYKKELVDNFNKLLLGQKITIETVEEKKLNYPPHDLVKVYLTGSAESVNVKLLTEGMAFFDQGYYPGKNYFYRLQKQAEKNKIGIWKYKEKLKILYIGAKSWKEYHLPSCPEVNKIKESEKIYFYFNPPQIFDHRYLAVYCPYCREKF